MDRFDRFLVFLCTPQGIVVLFLCAFVALGFFFHSELFFFIVTQVIFSHYIAWAGGTCALLGLVLLPLRKHRLPGIMYSSNFFLLATIFFAIALVVTAAMPFFVLTPFCFWCYKMSGGT